MYGSGPVLRGAVSMQPLGAGDTSLPITDAGFGQAFAQPRSAVLSTAAGGQRAPVCSALHGRWGRPPRSVVFSTAAGGRQALDCSAIRGLWRAPGHCLQCPL
ncbi:unnamed protein product [Arctogadus glacialis]